MSPFKGLILLSFFLLSSFVLLYQLFIPCGIAITLRDIVLRTELRYGHIVIASGKLESQLNLLQLALQSQDLTSIWAFLFGVF